MAKGKPQSHSWSPRKRQAVWEKTAGHCWYCGGDLVAQLDCTGDQFCIDHLVPWSEGGTQKIGNLVPACRRCNASKRNRSLEAYRCAVARRGLPIFTPEHTAYLQGLGIALPADFPCYPTITFWFEEKGLAP